jgi:hypothetical protein
MISMCIGAELKRVTRARASIRTRAYDFGNGQAVVYWIAIEIMCARHHDYDLSCHMYNLMRVGLLISSSASLNKMNTNTTN